MELDQQLAADLDALVLSDIDSDDDMQPLPDVQPLAPIEQLCAESEAHISSAANTNSSLLELQRMLSAGDAARSRFEDDVSALHDMMSSAPLLLVDDAEELAAAPAATSTHDNMEGEMQLPWWVHERRVQAEREAEREADRARAAEAAWLEREEAMRKTQRAADEAVATAAAELEAMQVQLQAEMEARQAQAERERLERESRALALAAEREAEEATQRAAEAERVAREAERLHRERKRKQRDEELRRRIAEAEAEERRRQEREEREAQARARMEARALALKYERQKQEQREEQRSATTRMQSAIRGVLARALRSQRAKQRKEEAAAKEAARLASAEAERKRLDEEAAAERQRQEEERARQEAEERARREQEARREAIRARREAEAKRAAEEAARREAERRRREAEEARKREEEARQRAEEERKRRKAEAARRRSAVLLQACARGHVARLRYGPSGRAATTLQNAARALLHGRVACSRVMRHGAAVRVQAVWRGAVLRQRLRRALDDARFDDDDDFDYAAVDDAWLTSAMDNLDDGWGLNLPSDDDISAIFRPASVGNTLHSPLRAPMPPAGAAEHASCASPTTLGDGRGLLGSSEQHEAPRAASSGQVSYVQIHSPSAISEHGTGGKPMRTVADRDAALREVADEWGFTDQRHAAGLLKRKQKMLGAKRAAERRKQLSDPLKRLEALQRNSAAPNCAAGIGDDTRISTRRTRSTTLVAPKAGGRGALRRLVPSRFNWTATEASCNSQMLVLEAGGSEVQDELDLASVASCAEDESLRPVESRTFSSDSPNLRLSRSFKAPTVDRQVPARMNNFFVSPPQSASQELGSGLPVGAALHAARANR